MAIFNSLSFGIFQPPNVGIPRPLDSPGISRLEYHRAHNVKFQDAVARWQYRDRLIMKMLPQMIPVPQDLSLLAVPDNLVEPVPIDVGQYLDK